MGVIELGADVESPRRARSFVTNELLEAGVDPATIADAALLTNELVTNAVIHARTEMVLTVAVEADHVRVSVTDHSTEGEPVLRNPRADEATGRGLFMVDRLASDWDITTGEGGTTVSFRLETQRIGQNQ